MADAALEEALSLVRPGTTERDVALAIENLTRRKGAEGPAFEPVLASGPRSALPHGRASTRRIEAGGLGVIDIGARFEGYHSDMTRLGPRSDERLEAGMVLTIEPGVHLPGRGGVRIEDMVLVTGAGARRITPPAAGDWILECP